MSFHLPQELPENMQDIIRSAVNIVNDDFDYAKFMQAFSRNDPWSANSKNIPSLSPQVSRNIPTMDSDPLKSCPPFRQPAFTFDEACISAQETRYPYNMKPEYAGSSEKVGPMMNEDSVRKAVTEMVYKNGVNMGTPILKLQITGNSNYELDESDILNIFSRYGNVQRIEVGRFRTAYIVYDTIVNALVAQKLLHSQYIKHLDIKLYLSLANSIDEEIVRPEDPRTPSNNMVYNNNEFPTMSGNTPKSQSLTSLPSFPYNPTKHTCKYEIQIDNDKDFKIARKIIGPKGCNMKKIIEICQYHLKRSDIVFQSDFLKLRLRGRGSGFKEGPEQKESDDPLHLCVSSKYPEVYSLACKLVEDLLGGLYKEYGVFRQKAGRPLQEPVQIKRIEISNGGSNEKKTCEDLRGMTPKSRQNSTELLNLGQNFAKSLSLNGNINSGPESSNNSISTLSDREGNNSPPKQVVQLDEPDFKSP